MDATKKNVTDAEEMKSLLASASAADLGNVVYHFVCTKCGKHKKITLAPAGREIKIGAHYSSGRVYIARAVLARGGKCSKCYRDERDEAWRAREAAWREKERARNADLIAKLTGATVAGVEVSHGSISELKLTAADGTVISLEADLCCDCCHCEGEARIAHYIKVKKEL
jgi:hypothetical protein